MPDRARYDGPFEELVVRHPETDELLDTVKRGGLLSKDVPAAIRDELLERDDWTAVKDSAPSAKSTDKKED